MVLQIENMLAQAFNSCISWFVSIVNATRSGGMILSALSLFFVVSFIIIPLRGAALSSMGSDIVKSAKGKSRADNRNGR